jgi:hypothetical protein
MAAASLIAPAARDDFLRHLAAQLGDAHKPSDARLTLVICDTLAQRGVAVGRQFFGGDIMNRASLSKARVGTEHEREDRGRVANGM